MHAALVAMAAAGEVLDARPGRPEVAPEQLRRALLLRAFSSPRPARQLRVPLEITLLCRWVVGLGSDARVWAAPVFTKHRARLLAGAGAARVLAPLGSLPAVKLLLS